LATHNAALSKPLSGDGATVTLQSVNLPLVALHSRTTLADCLLLANLSTQLPNSSLRLAAKLEPAKVATPVTTAANLTYFVHRIASSDSARHNFCSVNLGEA
jgi:hypothetical protein